MRVLCILLYIVSLQMGRDSLHTLVVTTEWDRIMAGQLVRAWQFICQVAGLSLQNSALHAVPMFCRSHSPSSRRRNRSRSKEKR